MNKDLMRAPVRPTWRQNMFWNRAQDLIDALPTESGDFRNHFRTVEFTRREDGGEILIIKPTLDQEELRTHFDFGLHSVYHSFLVLRRLGMTEARNSEAVPAKFEASNRGFQTVGISPIHVLRQLGKATRDLRRNPSNIYPTLPS